MKEKTAVEWFMNQIGEKQPDGLYVIDTLEDVKKIFEQAKAMEKEQSLKMLPYDLDELAKEFAIQQLANPNEYENSVYAATIKNTYMTGFQKALELLTFKSE